MEGGVERGKGNMKVSREGRGGEGKRKREWKVE